MEPRIQYARASDGVSIAYAIFGEGTPLVSTPSAYSMGVHYYSHMSYSRRGIDEMAAAGLQVIRYDGRGVGSSDRAVTEFSLETAVLDLEAVVERTGFERFALLGHFGGVQSAIACAARWPERVTHLILRDPWPSAADQRQMFPGSRVLVALRPFAEKQWELVCTNIAAVGFGLTDNMSREYADAIRSGITPETWVRLEEAADEIDVTRLLAEISVPTLVVLDTALPGRPPSAAADWGAPAKKAAALIPNAHLVSSGDLGAAVSDFVLGRSKAAAAPESTKVPGGLQTILFTDVEDSTVLTERLGDAKAREVMREHERITREALKAHGGSEVKTMGDGFMASFGSATRALQCATAVQRAFADGDVRVRIGLNAGEPIAEDDPGGRSDLYGTAVIVAARIAAKAEGGEILVSDVVRQLVAGKGFLFNDRGEHALKGFEDPVRVFAVRWQDSSS